MFYILARFSISKIEQIGDVKIIENSKGESIDIQKAHSTSSKSQLKYIKSRKFNKRKSQNHFKLDLECSRKEIPEKNKTPKLVYKNSSSDTFFLNSSGQEFSAVLSSNAPTDLKKYFYHWVNCRVYSQDFAIKQNTYYYLFSKDTGKLYQFFNKPPPISSFS